MEDDFDLSVSPPASPCNLECEGEVNISKPPCFSCLPESGTEGKYFISSDGYIKRGYLKRLLLRLDPSPTDFETDLVELFGFSWVTEMALVESTKVLFGFFRQQLLKLENLVESSSHDFGHASSMHYEAEEIRKHCVKFLQYVKVFISRFFDISRITDNQPQHPYEELEVQLPSVLLEELHSIVIYIGCIRDLPNNIQVAFSIQNYGKLLPPSWHFLHLQLDIHWSILEILHVLGEKMLGQVVYAHQFMNLTGETLTNISLFDCVCTNLLCDFIALAINRYGKVRPTDAITCFPFPCNCIRELLIMMISLLDQKSKVSHTESFWNHISKLLRINLLNDNRGDEHTHFSLNSKDPLGFSWWLLVHLAELYQYTWDGTVDDKKMKANWNFAENLLKLSCDAKAGVLEEQLRMYLQCCLTLCRVWDSNLNTVTILWEYYCKNLNSSFAIPWLGIKSLATVSKTPFSLLELVRSCCIDEQSPDLYKTTNSYHFFLRIIALQMRKETNGTHPWKQIKGRIYSKFHQRKMQELSETGLMHFLCLFLLLARTAEVEDVVSRATDLLGTLTKSSIAIANQGLIWKGLFAFLLIYEEKGLDIGALADHLSSSFHQVAKEFYLKTTDHSRKQTLWILLSTYIDGVQEVIENSSHLHLSEEKLLNEGFSMLLPACQMSELNFTLSFLQTVIAQLRCVYKRSAQSLQQICTAAVQNVPLLSVAKERHLAIATVLWKNFFPYLKSLRLSQTPPPQLADTAAGFALLAMDMPSTAPPDLQPQPFQSIMQNFGWDDMINPHLVSRFLSHLIQNNDVLSHLAGNGFASFQTFTIRSWFRCVLQMHVSKTLGSKEKADTGKKYEDQLMEFTRLVFKLPEMETLLMKAKVELFSLKLEIKPALSLFIKVIGKAYNELQNLSEKSAMVSKALEYVGDIFKYMKPYLVNSDPPDSILLLYWTVGCLLKSWAPILATSKAQQLLCSIIDRLLLPGALLQKDKDLPTAKLAAIKENLPQCLQGLSVISSVAQSQGNYIRQRLHSIVHQYLSRFLPAAPSPSGIVNHPVLLAVCEPASIPSNVVLQKVILQVVLDNFMHFKGCAPPPRLASVLAFLHELLRRTKQTDQNTIIEILPAVLKCLLFVNELQVKKLSSEIVQLVIEDCRLSVSEETRIKLASVFRKFIEEHVAVYDQQVYSVLEMISILDRSIIISQIPILTQSLMNSEHKRGVGKNNAQRSAYKKLLSCLGEEGEAEIAHLDAE
ncbi:protein MMS22-like [Polypterus senegalus]|uniref:protein MMS22-like n=1 Tax=Polypterus senegalus TaxID=55291 RepID=UPI0019630D3E|nr:protein MMS22-like [Polypterus senegalus]